MDRPGKNVGEPPRRDDGGDDASLETAAARLRRTVAAVVAGEASRAALETAAGALVEQLRSQDEPPEQMLLRIKEILADAGLRPTYAPGDVSALGRDTTLYRDVIAWCIRHYYDGPASR